MRFEAHRRMYCTVAEYFEHTVVVYSKDTDKAEVAKQLGPYFETGRDQKSVEMIREVIKQVSDGSLQLAELEKVKCIRLLLYDINL